MTSEELKTVLDYAGEVALARQERDQWKAEAQRLSNLATGMNQALVQLGALFNDDPEKDAEPDLPSVAAAVLRRLRAEAHAAHDMTIRNGILSEHLA